MPASPRTLALVIGSLAAAPLCAQDAGADAAHRRVAGCYALAPASEEPWLVGLERRIELTLEPVPAAGATRQRVARASEGPASGYAHFSWSVFGDGRVAQILWSGEAEQVAIVFDPAGAPGPEGLLGEATFFSHDPERTAAPVAVRVAPVACPRG